MYGCRSSYGGSHSSSRYFSALSHSPTGGSSGLERIAYSASALVSGDHAGSYVHFPRIMPMSPISMKELSHSSEPSVRYNMAAASCSESSYSASTKTHYELFTPHNEYHFQPEQFLERGKEGGFVGNAQEIRSFVEEAFENLMETPFPTDIRLTVCDETEFRKLAPHKGVIGLSFNRHKSGMVSEIFVLEGSLGRVLLTVGHEIGHVLSHSLKDKAVEEAKAYAFSFAWMDVIKEFNIAGLGNALVTELPALNGVHDKGFEIVLRGIKSGKNAWGVYEEIIEDGLGILIA
ncbi:hypothetical protein HYV86_03300 [Candidatus Woesearchaeota archaeon]|nr:hypothetical protein [Candidatus Woesearchaeota archaeon]